MIDIDLNTLLSVGDGMELKIFLLSRIPRLLAILCTGVGMSVSGLIMQQLCMNKFVSPSTGATIQSAQFGILLSLVWIPAVGLWGRVLLAFTMSILGTWVFVWFVQKIQYKNAVLVPLLLLSRAIMNWFGLQFRWSLSHLSLQITSILQV